MTLFYDEFCKKNGWSYSDDPKIEASRRAAWSAYNEAIMRRTENTVQQPFSGRITRTWMDDRAEELRRRSYRRLYWIIFPRQPLRIVRAEVSGI
jgi:hypothetical protein